MKKTNKKLKSDSTHSKLLQKFEEDLQENIITSFFKEKKVKRMLKNAQPCNDFVLKMLSVVLGKDENRIMLFYDRSTEQIYLMKIKTKDIVTMTLRNVDPDNLIPLNGNFIHSLKKFKL